MNIDMTPSLALVLVVGVLVGTGVYLLLERSLSRVIVGVTLLGNGVNILFLIASGAAGGPPLIGTTETADMSDPLPQAMVLTAIVINLGMTAFVLAMAYRSWQMHGHDEVQDDLEDRRIARRAAQGALDERADDIGTDLASEAIEARDETEEFPFDLDGDDNGGDSDAGTDADADSSGYAGTDTASASDPSDDSSEGGHQ